MDTPIRLEEFGKQLASLEESVAALKTATGSLRRLIRTAVIKDFELAFELCWKAGREIALLEEIEAKGPSMVLSMLKRLGIFPQNHLYDQMIDDRNTTFHAYKDKIVEGLALTISEMYLPLLRQSYDDIQQYYSKRRS